MTILKSGYVAIIGRPNVGESTLLNNIIGEKLSITSPKPQTTRWQILGIKVVDDAQIIYIDTPGLHREEKRAMGRYLNRIASAVMSDADVIVLVIDATRWTSEDELVLRRLKKTTRPIILVINKIDLLNKIELLPLIDQLKEKLNFTRIVPISALKADNISGLEKEIIQLLPKGPAFFPEGQTTDKSLQFQVAEIIREKIIQVVEEELPYTVSIEIEQFENGEKLAKINTIIWVERHGQKIIIIGKKGAGLKKTGARARRDIEKLLGKKVFTSMGKGQEKLDGR